MQGWGNIFHDALLHVKEKQGVSGCISMHHLLQFPVNNVVCLFLAVRRKRFIHFLLIFSSKTQANKSNSWRIYISKIMYIIKTSALPLIQTLWIKPLLLVVQHRCQPAGEEQAYSMSCIQRVEAPSRFWQLPCGSHQSGICHWPETREVSLSVSQKELSNILKQCSDFFGHLETAEQTSFFFSEHLFIK